MDGDDVTASANLVTKYSSPHSLLHRITTKFLSIYLTTGIAVPIAGAFGGLMWIYNATGNLAALSNWLTVGMVLSMGAVWIWVLLPPFAAIVFIKRRILSGIAPALLYTLWFGSMIALSWTDYASWFAYVAPPTFAAAAVIAVKYQLKIVRQLKTEPQDRQPKTLGCHGEFHDALEAAPASEQAL